jgi:prepilin-type N-terminal cleavage/methylation domain-containing protein
MLDARCSMPDARCPTPDTRPPTPGPQSAFTLIELLVVISVISLLVGILAPTLSSARAQARQVVCTSNLRQLTLASVMYTNAANGALPPCGWNESGGAVYWWGKVLADRVDHTASPLYKYLRTCLAPDSVYECPDQPWGTYKPQPVRLKEQVTSTYGYNGYYLTPAATPGWSSTIRKRPWQRLETIPAPGKVFMFADTLIYYMQDKMPCNNALLDPPFLYQGSSERSARDATGSGSNSWRANGNPTTAFRHRGLTAAACCDGHVDLFTPEGGTITAPAFHIGSVGATNGPHYVPDWQSW